MSAKVVYKIVDQRSWDQAVGSGTYRGSADDLRDGFIHLSTAEQLAGTLAKHFKDQNNLMLVEFLSDRLGAKLIWEPSRGGALFPHYYGVLDPKLAVRTQALITGDGGKHQIPAGLT
jgi:uncharacterized protein (DUF952 family)